MIDRILDLCSENVNLKIETVISILPNRMGRHQSHFCLENP